MTLNMVDLIEKKRLGKKHDDMEIAQLITGFTSGEIPDYQMSAWLMAVCFAGLDRDETFLLTQAMVESGGILSFPDELRPIIDKHSSGGVGDKVSLVAIPIIAACGGRVFKMSGRGLSHTGGTIDKLESVPGVSTALTEAKARAALDRAGAVILSQSAKMAPADKKIYALRDVTATVRSIPLIAASIVSKKIAAGADVIIFDIKVGTGSFLSNLEEAKKLATLMKFLMNRFGKRARFLISNMDEPLGFTIGNRIEITEALQALNGTQIPGLTELAIEIAAYALANFKPTSPIEKARKVAMASLMDGSASSAFTNMLKAQGASFKNAEELMQGPKVRFRKSVTAGRDGYIGHIDALLIGEAVRDLGGGRLSIDQQIDHEAGIRLEAKVGDRVTSGRTILTLYGNSKNSIEAGAHKAAAAVTIRNSKPVHKPTILTVL